jgi:hypothetical protein
LAPENPPKKPKIRSRRDMHDNSSKWSPGVDDDVLVPLFSECCICAPQGGLLDCNCSDVWYSGTILSKNRSKGKSGVFLVFFPDLDEDFEVKFDSETWILLDYSF